MLGGLYRLFESRIRTVLGQLRPRVIGENINKRLDVGGETGSVWACRSDGMAPAGPNWVVGFGNEGQGLLDG